MTRALVVLCLALLPGVAWAADLGAPPWLGAAPDSTLAVQLLTTTPNLDAPPPPMGVSPSFSPPSVPKIPLKVSEPESAPPPQGWFYHQLGYGSDALVHPVRLIVNGGFGILQFDNRDNHLGSVDFDAGWHSVSRNMRHPVEAIEAEGWWNFVQSEVLPFSANTNHAQYWPNYTLHLIGGGMSYTMMREWYQAHSFGRPRLWALATLASYHVLNEVVENDNQPGTTTDPVADLYLFDPASIILFSHEGVNGFFSRRLHLTDWSGQPSYDPWMKTIENHGQHFSMKLAVPYTQHWSFFYFFGNHGEGGLSYRRNNGSAYSVAMGFRARELVDLEDNTRTTVLAPSLGFFYDRNGSLMFSAQWANTSRYRLRINAYPGLLRVGPIAPGLFLDANKHDELIAGITLATIPIGLARRVSH